MDMQACTETLRTKVGDASGLNATLKFDCGADGVVSSTASRCPNTVHNENMRRRLHHRHHAENLAALLSGELEPATGFMMGKFKVSGDMSVAMKLQRVVLNAMLQASRRRARQRRRGGGGLRTAATTAGELFGITELCREFGITLRTIRFYEDKGLLSPRRINGTRVYTRRDRARLALILRSKAIGAPLAEIKHYLDLYGAHGEGRVQQLKFVVERTDAAIAELETKARAHRGHAGRAACHQRRPCAGNWRPSECCPTSRLPG